LEPGESDSSSLKRPGRDRVEIGVAVCGLALGLFVFAGSFSIDLGAGYDRIGPRFFPYLVAAGALFSGALLLKEALGRGKPSRPSREARASRTSGSVAFTLGLALASSALLLERAGFVLTAALLFFLVARAFASGSPLRDAAVGLALSVAAYLAFTRGLGLVLPGGLLGGLL
jgi:putative tricarboxylic transport membrane protein